MLKHLLLISILFTSSLFAQTEPNPEIEELKKRVKELEEIQNENSEIIKRQLVDQHIDQNSRGYIELKIGASLFSPKDIEDENDDTFNDADTADWDDFGHAKIFDFEIGKTIYTPGLMKHEIGVGYQHFFSKADASFVSGGSTIDVYEKIKIHTLFARYAMLFEASPNRKFYIGPGVTLGYSPISEFKIEVEEGNVGEQVTASSSSLLIELFGKAKFEFSRYFSLVILGGYRKQEAENLRVNAGDIVTVRSNLDLDASGFFGLAGLSVAF